MNMVYIYIYKVIFSILRYTVRYFVVYSLFRIFTLCLIYLGHEHGENKNFSPGRKVNIKMKGGGRKKRKVNRYRKKNEHGITLAESSLKKILA